MERIELCEKLLKKARDKIGDIIDIASRLEGMRSILKEINEYLNVDILYCTDPEDGLAHIFKTSKGVSNIVPALVNTVCGKTIYNPTGITDCTHTTLCSICKIVEKNKSISVNNFIPIILSVRKNKKEITDFMEAINLKSTNAWKKIFSFIMKRDESLDLLRIPVNDLKEIVIEIVTEK